MFELTILTTLIDYWYFHNTPLSGSIVGVCYLILSKAYRNKEFCKNTLIFLCILLANGSLYEYPFKSFIFGISFAVLCTPMNNLGRLIISPMLSILLLTMITFSNLHYLYNPGIKAMILNVNTGGWIGAIAFLAVIFNKLNFHKTISAVIGIMGLIACVSSFSQGPIITMVCLGLIIRYVKVFMYFSQKKKVYILFVLTCLGLFVIYGAQNIFEGLLRVKWFIFNEDENTSDILRLIQTPLLYIDSVETLSDLIFGIGVFDPTNIALNKEIPHIGFLMIASYVGLVGLGYLYIRLFLKLDKSELPFASIIFVSYPIAGSVFIKSLLFALLIRAMLQRV